MTHLVRALGISLAIGAGYAAAAFAASAFVPEPDHGTLLIALAVHLWTICLALAAARKSMSTQLAAAWGLSWGFLIGLSLLISLQNWRPSVNWERFLPALAVIPIAVLATAVPVYLASKWIDTRRRAKETPETGSGSGSSAAMRA